MSFLGAALFVAAMTVSCGNNNTEATDTIDSAAIEQAAEEQEVIAEPAEVLDTTPVVEEQTVKTTAKKVAQKVEQKVEEKTTEANTNKNASELKKQIENTGEAQTAPLKRTRR